MIKGTILKDNCMQKNGHIGYIDLWNKIGLYESSEDILEKNVFSICYIYGEMQTLSRKQIEQSRLFRKFLDTYFQGLKINIYILRILFLIFD